LLFCRHPVVVDAAVAACVDVHVEPLWLMLMSTAVAAGPTGIATAGVARSLLVQMVGGDLSLAIASVVVIGLMIG